MSDVSVSDLSKSVRWGKKEKKKKEKKTNKQRGEGGIYTYRQPGNQGLAQHAQTCSTCLKWLVGPVLDCRDFKCRDFKCRDSKCRDSKCRDFKRITCINTEKEN